MRKITNEEIKKRGCKWCTEHKGGKCKHKKCPYHELDNYDTYDEYLNSQENIFDKIFK